jgi:DNA anti-recombination protein RmuC
MEEEIMSDQQPESTQEVERIRDIIFGTQMRDYEGRFQDIRREIDRLRDQFEQDIDRLREETSERMASQNADQTKRLEALRRKMREADSGLRKDLQEMTQKLTDEKVDRLAMADMFSILAAFLQSGGAPTALFGDLEKLEHDQPDDRE